LVESGLGSFCTFAYSHRIYCVLGCIDVVGLLCRNGSWVRFAKYIGDDERGLGGPSRDMQREKTPGRKRPASRSARFTWGRSPVGSFCILRGALNDVSFQRAEAPEALQIRWRSEGMGGDLKVISSRWVTQGAIKALSFTGVRRMRMNNVGWQRSSSRHSARGEESG
jgi:hypothetical protein